MASIRFVSFVYLIVCIRINWADVRETRLIADRRFDYSIKCEQRFNGEKQEGDGGFQIILDGKVDKYAPEKKYTVTLNNVSPGKQFTQFSIEAKPVFTNQSSGGSFELFNNVLSQFSSNCPNTIIEASNAPKSDIKVFWNAPKLDTGCVILKASVVENTGKWYGDEEGLFLELCQGEIDSCIKSKVLESCHACSEAVYELTFEGLWSRHTHPKSFPENHFETYFTTVIGASHINNYNIWEHKKLATDGVAEMAKTGDIKKLERELKRNSDKTRTIVKAKGLQFPNWNKKSFALFRTDKDHHLLSVLSKINPSPDWVVGISAAELCKDPDEKGNNWIENRVINLYPIDVGVVNGVTYKISPKIPTDPQDMIRCMGTNFPNDTSSPFYNPNGTLLPLAKVTIDLKRVFKKECTDPIVYGNCLVSQWSNWGPCDVSCGSGHQTSTRYYINKRESSKKCRIDLKRVIPCHYPPCTNNCDVTEWSGWLLDCTCGRENTYRSRKYKNPDSRYHCSELLKKMEPCPHTSPCVSFTTPYPQLECAVTQWSLWSPCNATCTKLEGKQSRTRFYVDVDGHSKCNEKLAQHQHCEVDLADCNSLPKECLEPKDEGPCRANRAYWYYDPINKACKTFNYGGCKGNRNRFERYTECKAKCEIPAIVQPTEPTKIDCKLTEWSEWTQCSRTCGKGQTEMRRMIQVNPQHGGKKCHTKLFKSKTCRGPPCRQLNF